MVTYNMYANGFFSRKRKVYLSVLVSCKAAVDLPLSRQPSSHDWDKINLAQKT